MPDELLDCSFCGRNQCETLRMIKGIDACICRECIVECVDFLTSSRPHRPSGSSVRKTYRVSDLELKCAFCSRRVIDVRAVATINDSKKYICDECVMVCFDIMLRGVFGKRRPSDESLYSLIYK
jgi:ATP-dependent protease Clp ATPase subunit